MSVTRIISCLVLSVLMQVTLGTGTIVFADVDVDEVVGHGETCNDTSICNSAVGLSCIYSTCSCLTGQGFEYDGARCLGKVDAPCNSDNDCGSDSSCLELFCACKDGFTSNRNKYCKKSVGQTCTASTDCNQDAHLDCGASSRTCQCGDASIFVDDFNQCGSKINQPCDPFVDAYGFANGRTGYRCLNGGLCTRQSVDGSDDLPTYKCLCPDDMEASADNTACLRTTTTTESTTTESTTTESNASQKLGKFSLFQMLTISIIFLTKLQSI